MCFDGLFYKNWMNIELLRQICNEMEDVTEDIKWKHDLCFMVLGKIFCMALLQENFRVSFKVKDVEFEELIDTEGILPAPYVARYKWILIQDPERFSLLEWKHYLTQSYRMVRLKSINKKNLKPKKK